MIRYLLLCNFVIATVWATPIPIPQGDIASHIVIVTPQAQVHLEPNIKFGNQPAFIQHLAPLARFVAPHDETIVYVPAGVAAAATPLVPVDAVNVARSSDSADSNAGARTEQQQQQQKLASKPGSNIKQYEQISQQIEQIQTAIQQGAAMYGPQLSEAAAAAAAAASTAGAGFFPALFPPSNAANKDEKLNNDKPQYETAVVPIAQPLLPAESRHFYPLAPSVPQVVDFVHSPVFVAPISTVRARSIQSSDLPVLDIALPTVQKSEELPTVSINKKRDQKNVKQQSTVDVSDARKEQSGNIFSDSDQLIADKINDEKNNLKLKPQLPIEAAISSAAAATAVPSLPNNLINAGPRPAKLKTVGGGPE